MNQAHGQRFLLELPAVQSDLPFSPELLPRLFRLTDEEGRSPLESIAATIAEDQGLASRVLAMANSAFYGLQFRIGSVARAVRVLGLREIRSLVLALGIRGLSDKRPLPAGFDLPRYLEHQFSTALTALALARATGAMSPDDAFTAGVLHDIGKLVTALYRPDDWQAQAELAAREGLPWHEAETRHFGLDHGLIGAMVLRSWNLPEELTEPINWHHAPETAPSRREAAYTIACADACVRVLDGEESMAPVLETTAAALGLTARAALQLAKKSLAARDPGQMAAALA